VNSWGEALNWARWQALGYHPGNDWLTPSTPVFDDFNRGMTAYILFCAAPLVMWMLKRHGLEGAFLKAWIPLYLSIPFSFSAHIPGIPLRTTMQAAIIPLMFVLARDYRAKIKIGPMEVLMLLYMAIRVVADFLSRGYSDAQNYAAYLITCVAGTYLLGRYVISNRRMDIATSKAFVLIFLIFFPLFLYEAKFWVSPIFKILSPLFPDAFSGLSIRWGLARTAGTFEHPILACIMITAVYRLHRWLCWTGEWSQAQSGMLGRIQRWSKIIPLPFQVQISAVLVLMALMTISRGPWIGGLAGAALVAVGNCRNRKRALWLLAGGFLVAGVIGKMALDAYITPAEGAVLSGEAQTMVYRKEMIERYQAFLLEKVWSGWGLTTVPKIRGMESVDNAFFLMALQHGVLAPAVFIVMFLYAIFSQIRFGLKAPAGTAPLGFTFSGVYLMCFIAFTTVYMGAQTEPLLFLLLGWGESIKNRPPEPEADAQTGRPVSAPARSPFKRVLR
jgi:hypothetical protein